VFPTGYWFDWYAAPSLVYRRAILTFLYQKTLPGYRFGLPVAALALSGSPIGSDGAALELLMNSCNPPPMSKEREKAYDEIGRFAHSILKTCGVLALFAVIGAIVEHFFQHDNLHTLFLFIINSCFVALAYAVFLWLLKQMDDMKKALPLRTEWHDLPVLNSAGRRYIIRTHLHYDAWRTEAEVYQRLMLAAKEALFAVARTKPNDLSVTEAKQIIESGIARTVDEFGIKVMKINVSDISLPNPTLERSRAAAGIEL
jgi:hypothetical protein